MTEQQKDFVHMYLKHRDKIVAHNLVYGNNPNYDSVESSANRLLRIPEIAETIRSIQDGIRHEVEEEFKARYREELMTIYEKRLLLKKIATGEMYVEQKYKGKNCTQCTQCSQYISPTINQMLAAIREDNKLAGHYPHKQNGKWVIPALQTGQEQDSNPPEKDPSDRVIRADNKGQQIEEQENTTETPLLFLGGDIGASASGVPNTFGRQSGCPDSYRDREEQETPQDNTPEKDNKEQQTEGMTTRENDNKTEQSEETIIDNQPLTQDLKTHDTPTVNSAGRIISQEQLRELLYPQKPKLSYMKNNP